MLLKTKYGRLANLFRPPWAGNIMTGRSTPEGARLPAFHSMNIESGGPGPRAERRCDPDPCCRSDSNRGRSSSCTPMEKNIPVVTEAWRTAPADKGLAP